MNLKKILTNLDRATDEQLRKADNYLAKEIDKVCTVKDKIQGELDKRREALEDACAEDRRFYGW